MAKSNIYTRTGDDGTTSLVDGTRAPKDSSRLEAYGTIDELSSALGAVIAAPGCPDEIKGEMRRVQNRLFNLGGYLASPAASEAPVGISPDDVKDIEGWIDAIDERLPKIHAFILPGGSQAAAMAHLARTICRRAERRMLTLASSENVDSTAIKYVNRLSDYLFIAARYLNFIQGVAEEVWDKEA